MDVKRDGGRVLSSSQFVSKSWEVYIFTLRVRPKLCLPVNKRVSQLKFHVLIGLGKPYTRKGSNYDWPEFRVG